eukprot:UN13660
MIDLRNRSLWPDFDDLETDSAYGSRTHFTGTQTGFTEHLHLRLTMIICVKMDCEHLRREYASETLAGTLSIHTLHITFAILWKYEWIVDLTSLYWLVPITNEAQYP